jgi:cytochrome c oxidase subunit 2
MPVQFLIGLAFVVMAACLVAVFATIALDSRAEAWEGIYQRGGRLRRGWLIGLLAFAVVVFILSMTWLPYGFVRSAQLPGAAVPVAVTAQQFNFSLDPDCIPADQPIDFAVQSVDVNHGFAIYNADGHLVGQVQAMPGFTNTLRMSFSEPGEYTVICDELCGPAHAFMRGAFTVGGCGGAASAGCGGGSCA